jgi:hypothetical protein
MVFPIFLAGTGKDAGAVCFSQFLKLILIKPQSNAEFAYRNNSYAVSAACKEMKITSEQKKK